MENIHTDIWVLKVNTCKTRFVTFVKFCKFIEKDITLQKTSIYYDKEFLKP